MIAVAAADESIVRRAQPRRYSPERTAVSQDRSDEAPVARSATTQSRRRIGLKIIMHARWMAAASLDWCSRSAPAAGSFVDRV